jgi:hypothetical protein
MFDGWRADLLHGGARLGAQNFEHALDTRLTKCPEAPQIRPADAHGLCAHCQCFDDVGAATEAAVDQHRHAIADRLNDFRQSIDGRATAVLDPPSVIGDDDAIDPGLCGKLGILDGENALQDQLDLGSLAQPFDDILGQIADGCTGDIG